jgi:uncharacterized protein YjiK
MENLNAVIKYFSMLPVFSILLFLFSCSGTPDRPATVAGNGTSVSKSVTDASNSFPYRLQSPDQNFALPKELTEISGIDVYKKSRLVCVNDEKGKVYIYDVKKGELKDGVDFGKKGDYESIAVIGDTVFVLSSNGNLHRITGFETDAQSTSEIKTRLDEKNDTEGLCYDAKNYRLLIACKQNPGNNLKGVRAVYGFDLKTQQLSELPAYMISLEAIKSFLLQTDKGKFASQELKSLLDPEKGDATFQPSEIAIHPVTDQLYLISSVGNLLLVMDRAGQILSIQSLDPSVFKQPEGLCFLENGDMYISDEGRNGKGNILHFKYRK